MFQKVLRYGLIAGLLVGIPLFVITATLHGHSSESWGVLVGYLTMLIALSTVFVAIKRHRDVDLGGVIGFWPAFSLGIGISVVAGICYVLAWEAALAWTHMDFAGNYALAVIEKQRAQGATGEALARVVAEMDQFKAQYAKPLYRVLMTFTEIFPVGLLVTLISAGLLRNSRFLAASRR